MSNEVARSTVNAETADATPTSRSNRRSFLKNTMVAGAAATAGAALLSKGVPAFAQEKNGSLSKGDAAILRFVAAAEIIESDIWLQYNELAGVQDGEVSRLAHKLIPGYPAPATGGNSTYTGAILQLDADMDQYISDNTEDELSHEVFLNAYLASKGADTASLDAFRTLPSSQATALQLWRLVEWTSRSVVATALTWGCLATTLSIIPTNAEGSSLDLAATSGPAIPSPF